MQISNWFNFVTFTVFTLSVIIIGLPFSIYLLKKGAKDLQSIDSPSCPKIFSSPWLTGTMLSKFFVVVCSCLHFLFGAFFLMGVSWVI